MSRQSGSANLAASLEVLAGAPLDARSKVPLKSDLTTASNFPYPYEGMKVYVVEEKKTYTLIGNDLTSLANWQEEGTGSGGASAFADLTDVQLSNPQNGQVPKYNSQTQKWENANESGGSTYTAGDGINISNDEISVDEMPDTDMEEIITPLPSVMSRRFKYSTSEQVVGEWIDGKPIYQKTIDCGGLPNKSTKDVSIGVTDLKFIIEVSCVAKSTSISGGRLLPIPFARTDTCSQQIMIMFTDTSTTTPKIHISTSGYDYSGYTESYCTILYTKTTD